MPLKNMTSGGWLLLVTLLALPLLALVPVIDIHASSLFFDPADDGFWLRRALLPNLIHDICQWGARVVAVLAIAAIIGNLLNRRPLFGMDGRAALFILTVLLVGPGLVTNTLFKDSWGRARPYQIQEFNGSARYTPAMVTTDQCDHNCSFISGDGALGFSLHTLFYLVPPARRRRAFWLGWLGGGILFGGNRVIMGSHFLSDVIFSGIFMLIVSGALHTLFYGWRSTKACWRDLLYKT